MEAFIFIVGVVLVAFFSIYVIFPVFAKKLPPNLKRLKGKLSRKGLSAYAEWQETQNLISNMDSKSHVVPRDTVQDVQRSQNESYPFTLSALRIFSLLCLYCAVKLFQTGKEVNMPDFIRKVFPEQAKQVSHQIEGLAAAAASVLLTFEGLIGLKGVDTSGNGLIRIIKLSNQIQRSVEVELNIRLTKPPIDPKYKEKLTRWIQAIDDYFTASY